MLEVESGKLLILGPFELYPEFESLGIEGKEMQKLRGATQVLKGTPQVPSTQSKYRNMPSRQTPATDPIKAQYVTLDRVLYSSTVQ